MPSEFSGRITADGSSEFPAEAGRYHVYGSFLCPYACRAMMVRSLKGLQNAITMDILDCIKDDKYWVFGERRPGSTRDTLYNCNDLMEIYKMADPEYAGAVSVPVLWDKKTKTIVNNDSGEIAHMLATEMDKHCSSEEARNVNLYPKDDKVTEIFDWINSNVARQVYKPFYVNTDEERKAEYDKLFQAVDKVETILSTTRYVSGSSLTKADIHLFVCFLRVDAAFISYYKDERSISRNYPKTWSYIRELYQMPEIKETVNVSHIHLGYMKHSMNPTKMDVPMPTLDLEEPHGRS